MAVTAIDIRVEDVEGATRLLSEAYGWRVLTDDANFGEVDAGGVRIMLSREAMVLWGGYRRNNPAPLSRGCCRGGTCRGEGWSPTSRRSSAHGLGNRNGVPTGPRQRHRQRFP